MPQRTLVSVNDETSTLTIDPEFLRILEEGVPSKIRWIVRELREQLEAMVGDNIAPMSIPISWPAPDPMGDNDAAPN